MSSWNDLIQEIYEKNKHKPGYKLKDAMKEASPIWAKMKNSKKVSSTHNKKTKKGGKGKKKRTRRR